VLPHHRTLRCRLRIDRRIVEIAELEHTSRASTGDRNRRTVVEPGCERQPDVRVAPNLATRLDIAIVRRWREVGFHARIHEHERAGERDRGRVVGGAHDHDIVADPATGHQPVRDGHSILRVVVERVVDAQCARLDTHVPVDRDAARDGLRRFGLGH
jgi:hypothetical protein